MRLHLGPLSVRIGSLGSSKQSSASVPYPNLWMVPQARTEMILRERLRELGGEVEYDSSISTVTSGDDGVRATLANGSAVRSRYLVGCDGGRSTIRKAIGLQLEGDALSETEVMVAVVEVPGLSTDVWHVWPFAKGGALGLCPLPGTALFQVTTKATAVAPGLDAAIRKATGREVGRVAWSSTYRPSVRMVNRYRVGRVLLAGDAAHVHPPTGGQGLNTGVQDAYNLGWKLAFVLRGGPHSLLDTYEEERLPIAAAVLGLSKKLYRTVSIKRGDATNQLALHYRTSSLSKGASAHGFRPGDRMPDRLLADGNRLFAEMRGCHATELVMHDGTRVLVRPDGYIASVGMHPANEYAGMPVRAVQDAVRG